MTDPASEARVTRTPALDPDAAPDSRIPCCDEGQHTRHMSGSDMERRIAELEARIDELDAYAGAVTHDLRAPLHAVYGFACALEEDHGAEMTNGARSFVTKIITAAREMERLIGDLLALSSTGAPAHEMSRLNLREIVHEVLANLAPARANRVDVRIGWLSSCYGHAGLLRQLWTNLLSNALKFTRGRDPAVIEIGSWATGGFGTYFVRDNGVGFDMNRARGLFLPCRRFHDTGEYEGHGIGLATVRRIVGCHGGRLWAHARPGEGATFYFTLAVDNLMPGKVAA